MSHALATPIPSTVAAGPRAGVVVGIDPGLDKHGVVALVTGSCRRLGQREIPNTMPGLQLLARLLRLWRDRYEGRLTVAIEEASAYGEAVACYLADEGFELVVVSALKVARFKEAVHIDANDLIDAEAVARFAMVQPDLARAPAREAVDADPHGTNHQRLRQLSRRQARWTREQTAVCNELHAVLRMAWLGDYQRFFSRVNGAAALAFWQAYPTPAEAAQADPTAIAALLRTASRGRLTESVARAKAHTIRHTARLMVATLGRRNPQRWSAWAEDIRLLAGHLAYLGKALREVETQTRALLKAIDSPLLSFKGLGTVIAATLHGETLSVNRFATGDRFARFNGTAPREDSSGRSPRHVKNWRCNKRLRHALMQLALNAPRYHEVSRAYLKHLQARGITGGAARLRLARRLSDVVYAMLRDNRPYDVEYFLKKRTGIE